MFDGAIMLGTVLSGGILAGKIYFLASIVCMFDPGGFGLDVLCRHAILLADEIVMAARGARALVVHACRAVFVE